VDVGRPTTAEDAGASPFDSSRASILCLNTADPSILAAANLAERAPSLAALLLVRRICVAHGELTEKLDRTLTERALQGGAARG
jgi:hypothetical protein